MRVALISKSFDRNSGQGVYKMAGHIAGYIAKLELEVTKIEGSSLKCFFKTLFASADLYHYFLPELCWPLLFKKNSIVTLHDTIIYKRNERHWLSTIYLKLMHNIAKRAKHIITVSEHSKKDLIDMLNIPESKVSVIYWGVDGKVFRPVKREKNKIFTVGYVGGLGKRKNVELLIEAAKLLGNSVKVKIAGTGPQQENLGKLAEGLPNVEFVGFVSEDDLPEFYNSLDVFTFPSHYEGFGVPVLEAMACGIPVIAGNNSSMKEILGDAGILVNTNNAQAISEAITDLKDNPSKSKKLGELARKKTMEFKWVKTAQLTKEVYSKCLQ